MKIKNKISIIVIPILVLAIISINITFGIFFKNYVLEQEKLQIQSSKENIASYINEKSNKYLGSVNDWAHWDDTYNFINEDNAEYIDANMMEDTYINLDLSFIVLTDKNDSIVYKQFYTYEEPGYAEFPANFFMDFDAVIKYSGIEDDTSGVFQIGDDFYFVAASGITDSIGEKQPNGKMLIGRMVDKNIIQNMEKISGCSVHSIHVLPDFNQKDLQSKETVILNRAYENEDQESMAIELIVPNAIDSHATLLITLFMPRDLYHTGMKNVYGFALLNAIASIIITYIIFVFLGKYLSKPFVTLIKDVKNIDYTKKEFNKLPERSLCASASPLP